MKKRNLDDGINEIQKKLEEKDAELKDLKAELEYSLELNSTLSVKDRESNDELQGAHKELIKVCLRKVLNFSPFIHSVMVC